MYLFIYFSLIYLFIINDQLTHCSFKSMKNIPESKLFVFFRIFVKNLFFMYLPIISPSRLYAARASGIVFGPRCGAGDRMGCGIKFDHITHDVDHITTVPVFFTKNGKEVKDINFYDCVKRE